MDDIRVFKKKTMLDLIGRKMQMNDGEIFKSFFSIVDDYLIEINSNIELKDIINKYKDSYKDLTDTIDYLRLIDNSMHDEINGPAVEFLEMFSYVALGFMWLKMIAISKEKISEKNNIFFETKIATGEYFFNKILPKTSFLKKNIIGGASEYNDYKDKYFDSGFNL